MRFKISLPALLLVFFFIAPSAAAADADSLRARIDGLRAEQDELLERVAQIDALLVRLGAQLEAALVDSVSAGAVTDTLSFPSRLRAAPSGHGEIIVELPEGTLVRIVGYAGHDYWQVTTPEYAGYLHKVHFPGRPILETLEEQAKAAAEVEERERAAAFEQEREEAAARDAERKRKEKNALLAAIQPQGSRLVTLEAYMALQTGMSYLEACAAIGFYGTEVSRGSAAGFTTIMYLWTNPDGSNMNAMFQNDSLVQKAQFGLR